MSEDGEDVEFSTEGMTKDQIEYVQILQQGLLEACKTFLRYSILDLAKTPPDDAQFKENDRHAELCKAALAGDAAGKSQESAGEPPEISRALNSIFERAGSLDDIIAEVETGTNKPWPISEIIATRHKLTANINFNLYGGGSKEEGRKALIARTSLDEIIFRLTAADMPDGNLRGFVHVKKAITLETLSEKLRILEDISRKSQRSGKGMKREMINILADADRFDRFIPDHQNIMKGCASGAAFLAFWRFNKIMGAIQKEAAPLSKAAKR